MTNNEELKHHGVPGMKWGVRRQRDSNGNLTRYGAKKLSKDFNRISKQNKSNRLFIPVSYRDKTGKAHTVCELNEKQVSEYKKKVEKGALFGGVIGATISSKMYEIQKGKEITNHFINGSVNYTTIIKDTK